VTEIDGEHGVKRYLERIEREEHSDNVTWCATSMLKIIYNMIAGNFSRKAKVRIRPSYLA
jgi:hypothetical protein